MLSGAVSAAATAAMAASAAAFAEASAVVITLSSAASVSLGIGDAASATLVSPIPGASFLSSSLGSPAFSLQVPAAASPASPAPCATPSVGAAAEAWAATASGGHGSSEALLSGRYGLSDCVVLVSFSGLYTLLMLCGDSVANAKQRL